MSFRKRNVGINLGRSKVTSTEPGAPTRDIKGASLSSTASAPSPTGVRTSLLDGRLATSTGTSSLDERLAGHGGQVLGTSLLLEENGITDYAGVLLRRYAAEGLVQGHSVYVVGVADQWARNLPGCVGVDGRPEDGRPSKDATTEKMKIAWRYAEPARSGLGEPSPRGSSYAASPRSSASNQAGAEEAAASSSAYCHVFDLTKTLSVDLATRLNLIRINPTGEESSPYVEVLRRLLDALSSSKANVIHRLVIPSLLYPGSYPPQACQPSWVLQFFHGLRGLLRRYSTRLTAMVSLSLSLYPRSTGLVRWMELLSDGVLELTAFPSTSPEDLAQPISNAGAGQGDHFQGILQIHSLPIWHEKGGGGTGNLQLGENLGFTVSRKTFSIRPYDLPPVQGEPIAQDAGKEKQIQVDLEF